MIDDDDDNNNNQICRKALEKESIRRSSLKQMLKICLLKLDSSLQNKM